MKHLGRIGLVIALGCVLLIQSALWYVRVPRELEGSLSDFGTYYTAGALLRSGHASALYDRDFRSVADQRLGNNGRTLAYIHPAYEAVIFAPLSLLSYRVAYLTFLAINVVLALAALSMVTRTPGFPLLFVAGFAPITFALLDGQDSILMLFLVALSRRFLAEGKDRAAGMMLGLALFRFQVIVPIAICFLLWRRWRVLAGLAASGTAMAIASVLIAGIDGTRKYIQLLSLISSVRGPHFMVSLRGIVLQLAGVHAWLYTFIVAGSIGLIWWRAKNPPEDRLQALEWAIPIGLLTGYHVYLYDAAIAPVAMIPRMKTQQSWSAWILFLAAVAGSFSLKYTWPAGIALLVFCFNQRRTNIATAAKATHSSALP